MVLMLDTARYKYPPRWIKVSSLFHSMNTTDTSVNLSRGYVVGKNLPTSIYIKKIILFKNKFYSLNI